MALHLPPLSSLRLFEAAGRHLSFKLAAAELNITPSAVSHGIVTLEQALGVTLFARQARKLALTPAGADFLPYVSEALALIAIGTQRLPGRGTGRSIAVTCAPTLAIRWLLPRLPAFHQAWPEVDVTVDTARRQVIFPVDGFDFAIRMSHGPLPGSNWQRLFGERLVPVCAPGYRQGRLDPEGWISLACATLIHISTVSEDWSDWAATTGHDGLDLSHGLRFDTIQLALEAAAAGLGVALGRRPLVDADLAAGRLVEARPESMVAGTAYWLVSSAGADHRADQRAFRRWLLEEAARSRGPADIEDGGGGGESAGLDPEAIESELQA